MIEINKNKTEQAWQSLYHRLETDGLLAVKQGNSFQLRRILYRYVAAIFLLIVAGYGIYQLKNTPLYTSTQFISTTNSEPGLLVTTLQDGSIIYLAGNTTLQYPEQFEVTKREVILSGDALFEVEGNPEQPFLIDTENVTIEVTGTAFTVKNSIPSQFELAVKTGEVKVTLKKDGSYQYVKAGEKATLASAELTVQPTSGLNSLTIHNHQFRFKDETLKNVARVLNLHWPENQIILDPAIADRQITVTFTDHQPELMTELICLALNLNYTKQQDRLFISAP
ncbi:MAG: FecR family protein [Tannerellaceae bacterium]|nr:FecR family protein [Tannerellaceae bacterium]MCD8264416.1 FecR family protein [Tannerellaceae bacterium]